MVELIRPGLRISIPNMDKDIMRIVIASVGLQMVEAAGVAGAVVGDEVMMEDIDIIKENHAVSLQQEGEH
jgi:hypothetical protein